MKNEATFAWLNVRLRKNRIGSIGSRARLPENERGDEQGADDHDTTISGLVQP